MHENLILWCVCKQQIHLIYVRVFWFWLGVLVLVVPVPVTCNSCNLDKPPPQPPWTSHLFLSRKQHFFENLFIRNALWFYVQCTQIFFSFALRTKLALFYSHGSISFAGIELVRTKSCFWCALAHNKWHLFLGCRPPPTIHHPTNDTRCSPVFPPNFWFFINFLIDIF